MNQISPTARRLNALAAKPLRQISDVRELLINDHVKKQLACVAASHIRPERMIWLLANAIRATPELANCAPMSLLGSLMTCASLGLEPNTPLGHAFLEPFKNKKKRSTEVRLILGYKGMIDLARRSGHVANIHGDVAYEGDEFHYEYGSNAHLIHCPKGKIGKPTHAYCYAKLTDGEQFKVLTWDEVLAVRDASHGYRSAIQYGNKTNPWIAYINQMAAKTAVRALFNYLPISIEKDGGQMSDALMIDDAMIDFAAFAQDPVGGPVIDGEIEVVESEVVESESEPVAEKVATPVEKPAAPKSRQAKLAKPAAQNVGSPASLMAEKINTIIEQELIDGAPLNETLDLYDKQLSAIGSESPDEYDALIEKLTKFAQQCEAAKGDDQ